MSKSAPALPRIVSSPLPVVIVLFALPPVTVRLPVSVPAARFPPVPKIMVAAADPERVSVLAVSAVAFTVTISLAPLAVIEVAAEPVVIDMVLSAASPVVTVSAPVREPAAMFPTSPVTVSAAEPLSVKAVFCANAVAVTVTTSLAPLAVIEVAAEPVVMLMPLSAALPVVTVSAPVREPAAIFPTNPVTVSAAAPLNVNAVFCASAVAFTVTVSVLKLSVIEVAAEPVVIDMVLSVASPGRHLSAPVREPAVTFPISPVTTSAAEPTSVSAILLASAVALTLSVMPLES